MSKRKLCNYANASDETEVKGALYQRGQFYIMQRNQRRGDRRRYVVFMNDDLIGLGGSLVRLKRFVNTMYKKYPFATDVTEDMVKVIRKNGKIAQMDLRPQFDDTVASIREQMEARKERLKKSPGKTTAAPGKKTTQKKTTKKTTKKKSKSRKQQFLFDTDVVEASNEAIALMIYQPITKRALRIIEEVKSNGQFTKAQLKKVMKAFNEKKRELIIRDIRRDPEGSSTATDILQIISNAKRNPTKRIEKYFEQTQKLKTETLKQFLNDYDSNLFRLIQMYVDTWQATK